MQKIAVNSLPVDEVIKDISDQLGLPLKINCRDHYVKITGDLGEGYINAMMLESGLGIIEYNCTFNNDIEFHFVKDSVHPLKFLYCTKGELNHCFTADENVHELHRYQQAIVASKDNNGHVLKFKKNTNSNLISLEMDRAKFMMWDDCSSTMVNNELNTIFGDINAKNSFYHEGYYSLELADVFEEIKNYDHNYFLKTIFMVSSGYKLLGKQILQYKDDLNNVENRLILRRNEVASVHKAAKIINETIEKFNNIETIVREVGLSEAKLQQGFKLLYDHTINSYVNEVRLEMASKLLRTTEFNISEIVYKVGLSSRSYFSKIFKEAYDCSPREYRKKFIKEAKD